MNEVFKETEIMVEEVNTYIFSGQLKYSYLQLLYVLFYIFVVVRTLLIERKKRFV